MEPDKKRVVIDGVTYKIGRVDMEEFDLVWSAGTRLLSLAIKGAKGIDLVRAAKDGGNIGLQDLNLGNVGDALQEVKDLLGWQFLFRELGLKMAKYCEVVTLDGDRRLDAIYAAHWNEHGPMAFMRWTVEALQHNCADFTNGLGALLNGSETPKP